MLYYLLRVIFRVANRFYFRTLQVKGAEHIPEKGAVFFVANHPSAFMDPIVIATITKRRLFFLAKGALFKGKVARWLLPKFNMIPIFRGHETSGQARKNKEVFSICYAHLAKGGAMLAFPEGISITERKLKKIQSGVARICLGAEAEHNFMLNIKIITVGLNFSNPHKFYSDLLVNVDAPISVSDFYTLYQNDAFKGAHALTDEIHRRLELQIVAMQDAEEDKLVGQIEQVYKSQLLIDLGHSPGEMIGEFHTTKAIRDTVQYFKQYQPERVQHFQLEMEAYLFKLNQLKLSDALIKDVGNKAPIAQALLMVFQLILGFPVFVFGFINNYLPFRIPFWSARFISKRPDYYGSIALSLGTLTFISFYTFQIWMLHRWMGDWRLTLFYAAVLPLSGVFAFLYYRRFKLLQGKWMIFSLLYKKTTLLASLISKRQYLIHELEKGRADFERRSPSA